MFTVVHVTEIHFCVFASTGKFTPGGFFLSVCSPIESRCYQDDYCPRIMQDTSYTSISSFSFNKRLIQS